MHYLALLGEQLTAMLPLSLLQVGRIAPSLSDVVVPVSSCW
jgi:hypothetical protein